MNAHTDGCGFCILSCSVKKSILRLIEVFVDKCDNESLLAQKFVPALMGPILGDYASSVPDAR